MESVDTDAHSLCPGVWGRLLELCICPSSAVSSAVCAG